MKKQLIIESALELFSEQGIEATSIQQITDKCGISKGAFYLSFKSKDELIYSLIDHFVINFTTDVEHLVNSTIPNDQIMHCYLELHINTFVQNSSFAKLLMKDHTFIFNQELVERLHRHYQVLTTLTYSIVEKRYTNLVEHMKHDIVFFLLSILKGYTEAILFSSNQMDVELLCNSIEEKLDIIAKYATIPFTENAFTICNFIQPMNEETLVDYFNNFKETCADPIVKQSITLLLAHLNGEKLLPAIEQGLLLNLKNNTETKHLTYLYNRTINAL